MAITPTGKKVTEFSGQERIVCGNASPANATDTLTLSEFTVIDAFVATFSEATDANCSVLTFTKATNVITLALKKPDGATAASTFKDFDFIAIGH